jgi:hypothetical protein
MELNWIIFLSINMAKRLLRIYVFPCANGSLTLHPAFLPPKNNIEQFALFSSYVVRKWRYQISDFFGYYWHSFGRYSYNSNPNIKSLYTYGNRLSTRKASGEYFLKMIPDLTEKIEFSKNQVVTYSIS